ncbi:MAG TPA: hypothetical protein DEB31_00925, partial [Clostridiales bacterium]|nr:hypothetical protein [Clostridiales bacterium]
KMEIILAMAAGFLLGAYIRKPFALVRVKEKTGNGPPQKRRLGEVTIEDEIQNMVNYTGLKE